MISHPVHIRGSEFAYVDWGGSGPLLHISHSIGFCAGVYSPLAERLNDRFHVIGSDSRGHGRTKAPADPRGLKNWVILYDDLEGLFKKLDQPLVAVGHSMGGTLSLVAAIRRPDLVRALIMIEPGIIPPAWRWGVFLLQHLGLTSAVPMVSRTARRKDTWPNRGAIKKDLLEKAVFRNWKEGFLDAYVEHALTENKDGSVRLCCDPAWEARCIAMAPTDIWRSVRKLRVPTLVLYGERSKTFLPAVAERFRTSVPHALFKRFEGAGHNIIMENPDAVVEAVWDFAKSII
jgi:pimeloyl-ACP methyl ester carboxylesterase